MTVLLQIHHNFDIVIILFSFYYGVYKDFFLVNYKDIYLRKKRESSEMDLSPTLLSIGIFSCHWQKILVKIESEMLEVLML